MEEEGCKNASGFCKGVAFKDDSINNLSKLQ